MDDDIHLLKGDFKRVLGPEVVCELDDYSIGVMDKSLVTCIDCLFWIELSRERARGVLE